jgi:hypothetical protein
MRLVPIVPLAPDPAHAGPTQDPLQKYAGYDPQAAAVGTWACLQAERRALFGNGPQRGRCIQVIIAAVCE